MDGFERLGTRGLGERAFARPAVKEEDESGAQSRGAARLVDQDLESATGMKQPRRVVGYAAVRGTRALRSKAALRPEELRTVASPAAASKAVDEPSRVAASDASSGTATQPTVAPARGSAPDGKAAGSTDLSKVE